MIRLNVVNKYDKILQIHCQFSYLLLHYMIRIYEYLLKHYS